MWSKKFDLPMTCPECRAKLLPQEEACTECSYPVTGAAGTNDRQVAKKASDLEYKLVQLLGAIVFGAGVIAILAESPIAATVALTVGGATYLSGLMGSWWNSGD